MVDAVHAFGTPSGQATGATGTATLDATVLPASPAALETYGALSARGVCGVAQRPIWVGNWIASANSDAVLAFLLRDGAPVLALALEVARTGPLKIARFMGGSHANGNFPLLRPDALPLVGRAEIDALTAAIRRARPDIDFIALQRMLPDHEGIRNPLMALPHAYSANISLAVDLDGGFDALLKRSSGKRKRKKYRTQTRKFEGAGGHRRIEARTPQEVDRLLDAFLAMKATRFRKAGIRNVFEDAGVQAFFRDLFRQSLEDAQPQFLLHGLEVGGTLRAVTGSSLGGRRIICEFGAIVEDELAHASPGDFLFFENIREACERGFAIYDYSVGDELYKRLWCDIETWHVDVLVPFGLRGRGAVAALGAGTRAKAFVKNSPVAWKLIKALRRRRAESQPAQDDD